MKPAFALLIPLFAVVPTASVAEQSWELRGEVVEIRPGEPEVVVLRLADGRTIDVPLESLSVRSQAEVRREMATRAPSAGEAGGAGEAVTVRGPFGRSVRVPVPECIKDVEADAIHCRTATAAVDVYRLFLAGDRPTAEQRTAADARQREWAAMADSGLVRLGDRWVPPAEASAAAAEADHLVDHALELLRIGKGDLATEELRKAIRVDPESGRPHFVMGLGYALVEMNHTKAADEFVAVVQREPDDGAALNNLAVLEVLARRYALIVEHFRASLVAIADPNVVVENVVWAMNQSTAAPVVPAIVGRRPGGPPPKLPGKTVDDLNTLYRTLTQDLKFKPPATVAAPRFLGPDGLPCTAANLADVAKQVETAGAAHVVMRRALGFVVGPGHVICPRQAILAPDGTVLGGVAVELPTDHGRRIAATVVAAPEGGDVALLACEGLSAEPVPLAAALPPLPAIAAVERSGDSWLAVLPSAARGKVLTPVLQVQARGRFVHTAVVPRGLGGGPIVDDTGRIVGMVAATPRTEASGNAAGFGIPVERIWRLVKEHLPDVEAAGATSESDAAAAERRAIAGTVVVSATRDRLTNGSAAPGMLR